MQPGILQRAKWAARVLLKGYPTSAQRKTMPSISLEQVAEAREFFPLDKFFVFGHARSGTTLLARLIRVHPDVYCNWQAHFFTRPPLLASLVASEEVESWLSRRSNRWNRGEDLSPLVLRVTADFILEREARRLGKTIVGDKSPSGLMDGQAVHLMRNVYPDARLIYIVRDGRDTAVSQRFQRFIDGTQHLQQDDWKIRTDFSQDPTPFQSGERSIFTEKGIRTAAEGWVRNVLETHQLGQELYGEAYHELRYEDLLADPWVEMIRVWSFLGADVESSRLHEALDEEMQQNPDAEWQKEKAVDIAGALAKGKRGTWRDYFTERDRRIFEEIAGETLQNWGYPATDGAE